MSDKTCEAIKHKEKRVTFVTFKEVDNVRQRIVDMTICLCYTGKGFGLKYPIYPKKGFPP